MAIPIPAEDFDFDTSNAKFNKADLAAADSSSAAAVPIQPAYNKSSFFDNLSCDALDRTRGGDGEHGGYNKSHHELRDLDYQTFGQLNDRRGGHPGSRGAGGRGGRGGHGYGNQGQGQRYQGGGSGGGRGGGYHNNNNNRGGRPAGQSGQAANFNPYATYTNSSNNQ